MDKKHHRVFTTENDDHDHHNYDKNYDNNYYDYHDYHDNNDKGSYRIKLSLVEFSLISFDSNSGQVKFGCPIWLEMVEFRLKISLS